MDAADSSRSIDTTNLSDEQKRQLRALRRSFRAEKVTILNDGWDLEICFMDGSTVRVNSKSVKLRSAELSSKS